jgi:hypothetical protein
LVEPLDPAADLASGAVNESGATEPQTGLDLSREVDGALSLIDLVERRVPEAYRVEIVRVLLPRAVGISAIEPSPAAPTRAESGSSRLQLARYVTVLATSGKTLLKALVALEATSEQLGIEWMTPSEIERFLAERGRVRSVYRTNVSNSLRAARDLVDRRRRGRGYEYRITDRGRAALERDLAIAGP